MVALLAINNLDLLAQSEGTKRILVIYDADAVLGWQAKLHALCLTNLLGHFSTSVTEKEIDQYLPGEMESYEATFYLGSTYQNMLPDAFLKDVLKTSRTICWLGYNLWHLAWSSPQQSDQKFEKNMDSVSWVLINLLTRKFIIGVLYSAGILITRMWA